jgi:hypothetical protein
MTRTGRGGADWARGAAAPSQAAREAARRSGRRARTATVAVLISYSLD